MESVAASPETAMELIRQASALCKQAIEVNERAIALVSGLVMSPELETLRAALSNVHDGLTENGAAVRAKEVPVGAFARARRAGEEEGFERGFEQGRRARSGHLALVHRAAG